MNTREMTPITGQPRLGRVLIEMAAMRLKMFSPRPRALASHRRVRQVVERQQQRRHRHCRARRARTMSQNSNNPIGRLPTSPRNSCATGRLNGAKPMHRAEQRERDGETPTAAARP